MEGPLIDTLNSHVKILGVDVMSHLSCGPGTFVSLFFSSSLGLPVVVRFGGGLGVILILDQL
jgi:hypothetical protein